MAFNTAVNGQITDSITQANLEVIGVSPAMALGNLYQGSAQSLANAAHNATNTQQQNSMISQTAMRTGLSNLYSLDIATTVLSTSRILKS